MDINGNLWQAYHETPEKALRACIRQVIEDTYDEGTFLKTPVEHIIDSMIHDDYVSGVASEMQLDTDDIRDITILIVYEYYFRK